MKKIASFLAMDILREAGQLEAAGEKIIHMEVGQPRNGAPAQVVERAKQALDQHVLGYTNALGIDELRHKISVYYHDYFGLSIPFDRVILTTGSSAGFVMCLSGLFSQNDEIALFQPSYPCYREMLTILGLRPVIISHLPTQGALPSLQVIKEAFAQRAFKGMILASPSNPTGTMVSKEELDQLCRWARDNDVQLISDEIYHGLTYGKPAVSAASLCDKAIVINSFSKYFCMTGWRIGWMVVPSHLVRHLEKLSQHLYISPPALSQYAAIGAFDAIETLDVIKRSYQQNRDMLMNELLDMGFDQIAPPDGAFYIYVNSSKVSPNSFDLCQHLLKKQGVALCSGLDFDPVHGANWLRMSYAGDFHDMKEAMERFKCGIEAYRA